MRKAVFLLVISILFMPIIMKAEEQETILEQTTKYYKTIYSNDSINSINNTPIVVEVSEDEYNQSDKFSLLSASSENTYQKLVSTISKSGDKYKYSAKLTWKSIPSKKSFDIIGIGFNSNVKVLDNRIYFKQNYCFTNGKCEELSNYNPKIFSYGAGCSFPLPTTGTLKSLTQELYFYVVKNTTNTISSQIAVADYSHAYKDISLENSKKFTVGATGITLQGVSSYYENMNYAKATWSGSW